MHKWHSIDIYSLLAIAICTLNLWLNHQQVIAESNNSSQQDSASIQTYLPIITIFVIGASAVAAWFTRHYTKKSFHFNALIKAFELLNDNAHRNARIRLYKVAGVNDRDKRRTLLKELGVKNEALDTIIAESQNIVLADLDQMGTLVKNGLILEKEFLNVYWNTIISCYEVLKEEKKTELYANFRDLYNMAKEYKITYTPLEKEIFGPDTSEIMFPKTGALLS
jgi:hypothetical protein